MEKFKILIIDDHPAMRHGIAQLIEREDDFIVCGEAGGRGETLELLHNGKPDLVILDIGLKDSECDGLELIPEIRDVMSDIPILIYSMFDEKIYAERALGIGANGYLMKQEPVRQIITAIRQILKDGIYVSELISRKIILARMKGALKENDPISPDSCLSDREYQIFRLIGEGNQPREIAQELCLSVKTVETHRMNIRKKMNIDTAAELTRYAIQSLHLPKNNW